MKKTVSILAFLLLCALLCSCGGGGAVIDLGADEETEQKDDSFCFYAGNVAVHMGDVMEGGADALLNKLGKPLEYTESNSCAYQGLDKVYTYAGFTIYTYPEGGVDYVLQLVFTDDSVSTPDGIRIGSPVADVAAVFGPIEEGKTYAEFTEGKTYIGFSFQNGVVKGLQYVHAEA